MIIFQNDIVTVRKEVYPEFGTAYSFTGPGFYFTTDELPKDIMTEVNAYIDCRDDGIHAEAEYENERELIAE